MSYNIYIPTTPSLSPNCWLVRSVGGELITIETIACVNLLEKTAKKPDHIKNTDNVGKLESFTTRLFSVNKSSLIPFFYVARFHKELYIPQDQVHLLPCT